MTFIIGKQIATLLGRRLMEDWKKTTCDTVLSVARALKKCGRRRNDELKRRIINKDKDLLQEYFRQAERLIRKNKKEEEIETVQTLIFISQVADYILEECE